MAEASRQLLLNAVKGLLSSGKHSDLVITCGLDSYKVHKNIVCAQSDFFNKAVNFPTGKEAQDGQIDLPEEETAIVKLLVQYFYEAEYDPLIPAPTKLAVSKRQIDAHSCVVNGNYYCQNYGGAYRNVCDHHSCGSHCTWDCKDFICDKCNPVLVPAGEADQLVFHAKMYEIGDRYNVVGLKDLSKEKFQGACTKFWDDPKFAEAAHYAFSTTPDNDKGLRKIVSETLVKHMQLLKKPEIESLMTEFNGLALGILLAKADKNGWF